MTTHPYVSVSIENGAEIILTPCPGTKGVDLETSIINLKKAGCTLLLTLMFDDEMVKNNIQLIPQLCQKYGITWLQLPIMDDEAPNQEFESNWYQYQQLILTTIISGNSLAIHCKGGTGRTGLVAAMILYFYGWPIEKVFEKIQAVRPQALKIEKQVAYLNSYVGTEILSTA